MKIPTKLAAIAHTEFTTCEDNLEGLTSARRWALAAFLLSGALWGLLTALNTYDLLTVQDCGCSHGDEIIPFFFLIPVVIFLYAFWATMRWRPAGLITGFVALFPHLGLLLSGLCIAFYAGVVLSEVAFLSVCFSVLMVSLIALWKGFSTRLWRSLDAPGCDLEPAC